MHAINQNYWCIGVNEVQCVQGRKAWSLAFHKDILESYGLELTPRTSPKRQSTHAEEQTSRLDLLDSLSAGAKIASSA